MDQNNVVRFLTTTVGSFIQDRLLNKEQRSQHKEQCAERLAAEDESSDKDSEVQYSDQAVLANLDWGIDALEEAVNTSNVETKMARLDYAEKMLKVCAMLDSTRKTAGVPNFYLSAWAHLNLSYLSKLKDNVHTAVLHILEMFIVDPFFSRIDFAPELWRSLFLPHMSSVVGWYAEERHKIMKDVIPDARDLSFTMDFDQYFDESLIMSVRPEQAERIKKLEQLYGQSLDENTRLYAKYYREFMNSYTGTSSRKVIPMLPIAEPPMTPLHEVSRSIPDYVKFGPILPKSAGFSPVLRAKENASTSRLKANSASSENGEDPASWDSQEEMPDEGEISNSNFRTQIDEESASFALHGSWRVKKDEEANSSSEPKNASRRQSQLNFSPVDSPKTPSVKSSPRAVALSREPTSMLRLLSTRVIDSTSSSPLPGSPPLGFDDSSIGSADSEGETTGSQKSVKNSKGDVRSVRQLLRKSSLSERDEGSQTCVSSPLSEALTPQSRPPKDFVCSITGQIFNDPVTLETGQTYERKAIQEWMDRGNTTCPITRQPLSAASLPKTNYVLKRLIISWKEQHPDLAQELLYAETPRSYLNNNSSKDIIPMSTPSPTLDLPAHRSINNETEHRQRRFMRAVLSTSPTSVISQAAVETTLNTLKPYILCLCNSEDLQECEAAVLMIARIWKGSDFNSGIHSYLSSPTIVNGFVEILSASLNRDVLRITICVLSELICADENVIELLKSIDPDFDCLASLLKKGLAEAAVLIYLLRPSFSQLSAHGLTPFLTEIISNQSDDPTEIELVAAPKDAAIALLDEIFAGGDESECAKNATTLISSNGIPALLNCLNSVDGRKSLVSILLCCIRADSTCRMLVAQSIELSIVLELLHSGNDSARGISIEFLCNLVQLSRRTLCNHILHNIKDEGAFSTMHALLVYLQMSPMEQKPGIASLLLQLDLLAIPRKMSIYREEALEALIEALKRKDFPSSQMVALDALSSLSGHFDSSGKCCLESWLLKLSGFDQSFRALVEEEKLEMHYTDSPDTVKAEEKAARSWEKRVAFVLSNHEKGVIFKALEECFASNSVEIAKSCIVLATWLVHMLFTSPDCGTRDVGRKSLLDKFINVLQSSRNLEEKILAALALRGFVSEPAALGELGVYAKCIWRTLRKLKKSSTAINDILKALMNFPSVDAAELWSCTEGPELDVSLNGEVLSVLHQRNHLISGHSDGTIKVWDTTRRIPRLIQDVREHAKAVTCLYVPSPGDKLYSGSLDKTIRVWSIRQEQIHSVQVHDVKEAVLELTANANIACFSSHGTGVKVYNWSGVPKHVNFNKHVKCLAISGDKLYCGCTGYSIQEVDLRTQTSTTFYSGPKKLLGKQTIYSLCIDNGLLFAGGSSVDGTAGKIFSLLSRAIIGSLTTGYEIQRMIVNNDFIFAATRTGVIEVWLKERRTKIASIKIGSGSNGKITSLASDAEAQKLFTGSSEGKIQVWSLD